MIIDIYKIRIPQIKLVSHLSMLSFVYLASGAGPTDRI